MISDMSADRAGRAEMGRIYKHFYAYRTTLIFILFKVIIMSTKLNKPN